MKLQLVAGASALAFLPMAQANSAAGGFLDSVQAPLNNLLNNPSSPDKSTRPNIIFVLTDDQDVHLDSLNYLPRIKNKLIDQGTLYKRHYCTTAICCPSRASIFTGKLAHNTNVTDLNPPYGGFPIFVRNGHNENYLPVWLQEAGYNTYYTGKMFNAHTIWNYDSPHLNGWTESDFLLDPNTYDYWNATFQKNKEAPVNHPWEYSTDLISEKARGFLDRAADADEPFFISIAPIAPHSNINGSALSKFDASFRASAPKPAKRHEHLFPDAKVPRTDNFNPDAPSGADWIRRQPKLTDEQVDSNDRFYRGRLQALQSVDELVDGLIDRLEELDLLDNTYIFYSADNGFHIGQHRLPAGKECGYETDINVPLIVRGPGVPKGKVSAAVTAHVDLVPTFLSLAGAPLRAEFDGTPIPLSKTETIQQRTREHVNVEYWGWALSESNFGFNGGKDSRIFNNTYKALRVVGESYNLYYSVWCTNEHELYDMSVDPGQLKNLLHPEEANLASKTSVLGYSLEKLVPRLDSLLLVLKSCKGSTCSQPWKSLHPQGDVSTLEEALLPKYDGFYENQVRVQYNWCDLGYIVPAEGPQFEKDGVVYWEGTSWGEWT